MAEEYRNSDDIDEKEGKIEDDPQVSGATVIPESKVIELEASSYVNNKGFDSKFLVQTVEMPKIPEDLLQDCAVLKDDSGYELKYNHFSIIMSKSRRLAVFTAVNLDGNQLIQIRRESDRWYFDPRIDVKYQSGPKLYSSNDLDRGHLVRRLDPVWGNVAKQANEDTFHFTNCSPQHKNFNQITWQGLEDYILKNADLFNLKVNVFTGPIFREDDMLYRGEFQIPSEFWKVISVIKDNGDLSATAYLQTQKNLIEDLKFAFGPYRTYQVPVKRIETLTKLDFGIFLRERDPMAGIKAIMGRPITGPDDILI